MTGATESGRYTGARTTAFVVLGAMILLGLAFGLLPAPVGVHERQRAELYRRGGDTCVRLFYLAHAGGLLAQAGGLQEGLGRQFLERSTSYYYLSAEADPSDTDTALSLALALSALGERGEALSLLSSAANREGRAAERNALVATVAVIGSDPPRRHYVEMAADHLRGTVPGRMVLAEAFGRMGEKELADQEWSGAHALGLTLVKRLWAALAVCGVIVLAGAIGLIFGIVRLFRRSAEPRTGEDSPAAAWGIREGVEALVVWVFVSLLAVIVLERVSAGAGRREAVYQLGAAVAGGVAAVAWVWAVSPRGASFGWRLRGWWRQAAIGVSAAGIAAVPLFGLYQVLQELEVRQQVLPGKLPEEHPLVPFFVVESGWGMRVMLIVAACVVVPFLEETLFRGVIYRALRRNWSFAAAALASAAIFAVIHMSWGGLIPYLVLGLVFAYLYERSRSLVAPWAAHGAFNGFNLAILLALFG